MMETYVNYDYYGEVSCIDKQIAELQARKDALQNHYCFIGYNINTKPYLDPYYLTGTIIEDVEIHDD